MSTLQRFVENIGDAFGVTEYSAQRIIHKLENEIHELHQWLIDNRMEDMPQLWKLKRELMLNKIENLNEIKNEKTK